MFSLQDAFVGWRVSFDDVDDCLNLLTDRWMVSFHVLASGEAGWYRRLAFADRVGTVATANAVVSLRSADADVPQSREVVRTLVSRQRNDGGWSFVSNLSDVSVVDATATVLEALQDWQSLAEFRDFGLPAVLEKGLDWIERAALPEGGWGLIQGGPYLNYSSALAVQVLCSCGRRASQAVHKALRRFMSEVDPATGGWYNANRHVSVPVTAEVIRALHSAADRQVRYSAEISKACTWLLAVARSTEFWAATQATANVEEIEVVVGGKRVRIEYGYSPRPTAIHALAVANETVSPEIVVAVRKLIDDLIADRWGPIGGAHHSVPTSWMLHDTIVALVSFRSAFSQRTASVWADNVRVVEHSRDQGPLVRTIREHKIKLIGTLACLIFAWMLKASGLVSGLGWATIFFVLSTVALNVAGNIVFELLRIRRRRRSITGI